MIENTDLHQTKSIPICCCLVVHMQNFIASHEAVFEFFAAELAFYIYWMSLYRLIVPVCVNSLFSVLIAVTHVDYSVVNCQFLRSERKWYSNRSSGLQMPVWILCEQLSSITV